MNAMVNKSESYKYIFLIIVQLFLFIGSVIGLIHFLNATQFSAFIILCKLGLMSCIVSTAILVGIYRNLFHPVIVIFMSFWIFQFGLPIVYALTPGYSNFYINLFDTQVLIKAAVYSIWCIQIFALGLLFKSRQSSGHHVIFEHTYWARDTAFVQKVSLYSFFILYVIVLPLVLYSALLSVKYGFNAQTRSLLANNAIFRMVQAFYLPVGFLYVCYEKSNPARNRIVLLLLLVAILQLVAGDRTRGMTTIVGLVYFKVFLEKETSKSYSVWKQVAFAGIGSILVFILVFIAQSRVSTTATTVSAVLSGGVFQDFFAELGLNFTTIAFVMSYVPSNSSFSLGGTYLGAIVTIIPKSIDPTGTIAKIAENTPEHWLFDINRNIYHGTLDFGVGFSSIGESYLNFSYLGIVAILILGFIVSGLLSSNPHKNSWVKYVQLIIFISLLTFPRRGFYDFVKSIEYSLFVLAFAMWVLHSAWKRSKLNE